MAKKARSSAPKKAAEKASKKPAVRKAVKKAPKRAAKPKPAPARKSTKKAPKRAAKPKPAPARKSTKKAATKSVTKPARKQAAKPSSPPLSPEVKAARQAEEKQAEQFERAARLFQGRKFSQAKPLLEKVAGGPNVGLSHRAGVYLRICQEQTARSQPRLKTVEEHYNYAVQLMNDRRLDEAEAHLDKALRMDRKAAHAHYALSVLKVLNEDVEGSYKSLQSAVALDPQNRILALRDPDLGSVVHDEPFKTLLSD